MNATVLLMVALSALAFGAAHAQTAIDVTPVPNGQCGAAACFSPENARISVGETITWTNTDADSPVTVTSGSIEAGPDGFMDSKLIEPGATYSHTFDEAGIHEYFSRVQPWMSGTVTVMAAPGQEPSTGTNMQEPERKPDNGCLIATAAYGSDMAPQIQYLREIRDNTILTTESGTAFMDSFNGIYYTFSPAVADFERENTIFRDAVKLLITPMLSSLSIMSLAESGSESHVMALGISVIALNMGMYVAAPVAAGIVVRKRLARRA